MPEEPEKQREGQFVAGVNEYAQLRSEQEANRAAFADRLEPSTESDQFKAEMEAPQVMEDVETGLNYAVYQVNRDKEGTPLVMNLAWSVPAGEGVGRADVHEFATHIDRPVIVMDMEATGKTDVPDRATRKAMNFEDLSAAHLRIIDQVIGSDAKFDISGYSLGGVMAAGIAAQAGERVGNVVTMAAPGFEDISLVQLGQGFVLKEGKSAGTYKDMAKTERPTIYEQDQAAQADTKGTITRKNIPALLKFATLMTKDATVGSINKLNSATKWTDIVGSKDAVSDWTGHLEAVRERNEEYPHSSTEHVLGSETHGVGLHRPAMAEVVAQVLSKADHDHELMESSKE